MVNFEIAQLIQMERRQRTEWRRLCRQIGPDESLPRMRPALSVGDFQQPQPDYSFRYFALFHV
jgi:hypothetical protein